MRSLWNSLKQNKPPTTITPSTHPSPCLRVSMMVPEAHPSLSCFRVSPGTALTLHVCLCVCVCVSCSPRCTKKNKLFLNVQINGNGCEDSPSRSPLLSARTPGAMPATAPYTLPGTPTLLEEHSGLKSKCTYCTKPFRT